MKQGKEAGGLQIKGSPFDTNDRPLQGFIRKMFAQLRMMPQFTAGLRVTGQASYARTLADGTRVVVQFFANPAGGEPFRQVKVFTPEEAEGIVVPAVPCWVCWPSSDGAVYGWGDPYESGGTPINPPLGTTQTSFDDTKHIGRLMQSDGSLGEHGWIVGGTSGVATQKDWRSPTDKLVLSWEDDGIYCAGEKIVTAYQGGGYYWRIQCACLRTISGTDYLIWVESDTDGTAYPGSDTWLGSKIATLNTERTAITSVASSPAYYLETNHNYWQPWAWSFSQDGTKCCVTHPSATIPKLYEAAISAPTTWASTPASFTLQYENGTAAYTDVTTGSETYPENYTHTETLKKKFLIKGQYINSTLQPVYVEPEVIRTETVSTTILAVYPVAEEDGPGGEPDPCVTWGGKAITVYHILPCDEPGGPGEWGDCVRSLDHVRLTDNYDLVGTFRFYAGSTEFASIEFHREESRYTGEQPANVTGSDIGFTCGNYTNADCPHTHVPVYIEPDPSVNTILVEVDSIITTGENIDARYSRVSLVRFGSLVHTTLGVGWSYDDMDLKGESVILKGTTETTKSLTAVTDTFGHTEWAFVYPLSLVFDGEDYLKSWFTMLMAGQTVPNFYKWTVGTATDSQDGEYILCYGGLWSLDINASTAVNCVQLWDTTQLTPTSAQINNIVYINHFQTGKNLENVLSISGETDERIVNVTNDQRSLALVVQP